MNIGLIDVDSHNFPNLCLMKISAYHKAQGNVVEWCDKLKHYDIVYVSKVFDDTYSSMDNTPIKADVITHGGTGFGVDNKLPSQIEHISPDYSIYPQHKEAYGFLTRGCPRKCGFCIVSKKEGLISHKVADLSEFWHGQKEIKLLDPNILACNEHEKLLYQLTKSKAFVDFTQGIDARCITENNAKLLSQIKTKMIHFAFDDIREENIIMRGLEMFKRISNVREQQTGIYILTNYNSSHDEDLYRIKRVRELGYLPYVMIYDKPNAAQRTRHLQRWCNNRIIYRASGENFSNYSKDIEYKKPECNGQVRLEGII